MEFLSRQTVRLPRWAIFVSPGRIHLTGRHVGDIAAERDGDVPGRGGGPAEMDGDIFRDDDPVQHPRHTGEGRVRAAAAVAGEEAVGWDDDGDVGRVPHLLSVGYHLGLGQRHLSGKDPVSYTHLDVYKRQVLQCPRVWRAAQELSLIHI